MSILNASRYPIWASLARDYLAIMGSSVSSERAFSSAGITISKRRNRLKPDIVEALQFLKCLYHKDLLFHEVPSVGQELEQVLVDENLEPASQVLRDGEDNHSKVLSLENSEDGWEVLIEADGDEENEEIYFGDDDDDVFLTDI
ncbi:hypothetical protein C0992_011884 [Termitomyces sp. T32_za158]|nr:hypothetical protein C0992_011884 [Termitomyces sp. T32_za158]